MTIDELSRGCSSYSVSKEEYWPARYYDTGLNGSFMGLQGRFTAQGRRYDGWGKPVGEFEVSDTYGVKLSPVQFYDMARQVMDFCNKEFGTSYDTSFERPNWVRPTFLEEQINYDKRDMPKYLDMRYPLKIEKRENKVWKDGAWEYREPDYKMKVDRWGDAAWGYKPKSFFLGLAAGFDDYIRNARDLPKGMYDHYNLFLMKSTEERYGLKPKYGYDDFLNIMRERVCSPSQRRFTDAQREILKDLFFSAVTKCDIGDAMFRRALPTLESECRNAKWIADARQELFGLLQGEERAERHDLHR